MEICVSELEKSLQHLHKLIIKYSPQISANFENKKNVNKEQKKNSKKEEYCMAFQRRTPFAQTQLSTAP